MLDFLKDQDQLGATPQMTYKGNAQYQTVVGGCCSCFASFIVTAYIFITIFSFVADKSYNQTTTVGFNPLENPDPQLLDSKDLIPAFQVRTENLSGTKITSLNDASYFDMYYQIIEHGEQDKKVVKAITCDKFIDKYLSDLSSKQLNSINYEMFKQPENFVCPDKDTYQLKVQNINDETINLEFIVDLSADKKAEYEAANQTE